MLEPGDREFARLADWVEGRLSEEESRAVEEQVASDSTMRVDVDWLRAFNHISKDTVIASPPPEVRGALVELFEEYARSKRGPGVLKRFVAKLSFDSGRQPALGLRGTSTPEPQRDFVYCSEVADITVSLQLRPQDGLWDFDGQIFPLDGTDPGAFGARLLGGHQKPPLLPRTIWVSFRSGPCRPARMKCLREATRWRSGSQGSKRAREDEPRSSS